MDHGRSADEYAALLYPLFLQAGLAFGDITGIALASVVPAATPALLRFLHLRSDTSRCKSTARPTSAFKSPTTRRTPSARTG